MRTLVARAPTRIDFGGGWTDVPPYPAERGGFVCNVAIDRYATVTIRDGSPARSNESPLVRAALARSGLTFQSVLDSADRVPRVSRLPVHLPRGRVSACPQSRSPNVAARPKSPTSASPAVGRTTSPLSTVACRR